MCFTSISRASAIFSDSFAEGYNTSLWSIFPGQFPPVSTQFGIQVDPVHSTDYSSLIHSEPLPQKLVIEIDVKINSQPATDMGIFVEDISTHTWKNVYTFGTGYGGVPNKLLTRDSGNISGSLTTWDSSIGTHHFKILFDGASNTNVSVYEDDNKLTDWTSSVSMPFTQITLSLFGTGSEFANFKACDESGCTINTPTVTITETPSPTEIQSPSPTNSPTPSPTSAPPLTTRKIVFVPGMAASWNTNLLLSCQPGTGNEEWVLNDAAQQLYGPLLDTLRSWQFTVLPLPYDWRRPITSTAQKLGPFISSNIGENEKVHLLGHSMGGLIGRAYVEQAGSGANLDRMLAVGSPFAGSPEAYLMWAGGVLPEWTKSNLLVRLAFTTITNACATKNHISEIQAIQNYLPSAQQLLPTFDYLRDQATNALNPVTNQYYKNNWLPNTLFTSPFYNIRVGTLTGTDQQTLNEFFVKDPSPGEVKSGLWKDGKVTQKNWSSQGDGTVLASSGQLQGSPYNITAPLTHGGLVSSQMGIDKILNFFGITATLSAINSLQAEQNSAVVIMSNSSSFSIESNQFGKRTDKKGMIALLNPKSDNEKLTITPTTMNSRIIIVELLADGRNIWNEYKVNGKQTQQKDFTFDITTGRVSLSQ